ncbi:10 kDa chaperonin [Ananas comosus]|uniref:10 kDa chaperonin n=1 Tax=Ananas comosus TaxID=4615 RepID=A0A199UPX7_ANACO|nr:10 kDa chaperonin [Ananas comosus]
MAASSSSFLTAATKPLSQSFQTLASPPSSLSSPRSLPVPRRRSALRVAARKWEPSKVVPQADRVLVRLEQLPEKSSGGVLLPKSAVKFERYLMGEILSVGADVGQVEAGKKVLFSDINAYEVDLGTEEKHCFCRAGDLLAVVE